jgi:hypothetical protein
MNRSLTAILFILLLHTGAKAQQPAPQPAQQPPLKLGISFFGASYTGDLTPIGSGMDRFYPGFNLSFQFTNKKFISPQLNAGFSRIVAQDRDLQPVDGVQPNTFVETPYFYVDLRLRARFLREKRINPWLSAGVGMLGYSPRDVDNESLINTVSTRNPGETYGSLTAAFPFSIGTEIKLSTILSLGVEYTHRRSGSDYLDNIGQLGYRERKDKINAFLGTVFINFDPVAMSAGKLRGKDQR